VGLILAAFASVGVFLILCSAAVGQTEEEMLTDARVKMKLKDYSAAEAILKEASQKYSSSVEIAETLVRLYEQTKNTEELIEACTRLIAILQLKEVKEKNLNSRESSLLKETEKKLAELVKLRDQTDAAVEQFVKEATGIYKNLVSQKNNVEASYLFQRLSCLVSKEEAEKLVQELGKENTELVSRPGSLSGANTEQAEKLLVDANKLVKQGKLDEAYITCKAALEADSGLAAARALLFSITKKMGKSEEMILHGFTYMLFPPEEQTTVYTEEIEKALCAASADLKKFFEVTGKCADEMCKTVEKAISEKRKTDIEYILERLALLTHRTKKVESILSKAQTMLEAQAQTKDPIILGKLLVSDDFSTPSNRWHQCPRCFYEKGTLIVKADKNCIGSGYASDFTPENFYLEAEMELIGDVKETTAGGLCFRSVSTDTYYAFMISPNCKFGVWLIEARRKKDLTGKGKQAPGQFPCSVPCKHIKGGKAKNVIAVACYDNHLYFYVNRRLIFACEEGSYKQGSKQGGIGFLVESDNAYAFDNFKVYEASLREK
jgi:tetratricopeptide (TPR) repeat protein